MGAGMNELRRVAYLEAMGVHSYVSRTQLPAAAITRRLAIAPSHARTAPEVVNDPSPERMASAPRRAGLACPAPDSRVPQGDGAVSPSLSAEPSQRRAATPRFSLVAIIAGDWLWLEELEGMPLATEQVQLVQSMALALLLNRNSGTEADAAVLGSDAPQAQVAQFDWPIHTNHQLDLGADAARSSVAGFIGRRLEQYGSRGVVLLGTSCTQWVPVEELKIRAVSTASTARILTEPALKREVWRDLLPLVRSL